MGAGPLQLNSLHTGWQQRSLFVTGLNFWQSITHNAKLASGSAGIPQVPLEVFCWQRNLDFSKEKREKREMTQANFSHLNWPRPLCGVATLLLLCVKGSKRPSKNGSIRDAGQHTTKII